MQNNYLKYDFSEHDERARELSGCDFVPSFGKDPVYAFDEPELELYHELSGISEEIGKCRLSHIG